MASDITLRKANIAQKRGPKNSFIHRQSNNHSFLHPCVGKINPKITRDLNFHLNIHKHTCIILPVLLFVETLMEITTS